MGLFIPPLRGVFHQDFQVEKFHTLLVFFSKKILFLIVETTKCCTLLYLLYPSLVEVDLEWWLAPSLVEVKIVVYSL